MKKWLGVFFLLFSSCLFANQFLFEVGYDQRRFSQPVEIMMVFYEPVVSMKDVTSMKKELSKKVTFDFTPKLKYTLHVVNETTLSLVIKDTLLPAREYFFTVRTSEKAMQKFLVRGVEYRANVPLYFRTPLQRVISGYKESKWPDSRIEVSFLLPVNLKQLEQKIRIQPAIDFSLAYRTNGGKILSNEVLIFPKGEKKNTSYTLTIQKDVIPEGGELPMEKEYRLSYKTYEPFVIERFFVAGKEKEYEYYGENTIVIKFNNELADVKEEVLRSWVKVSPEVRGLSISRDRDYLYMSGVFEPFKKYIVTAQPTIVDQFGQSLEKTVSYSFEGKPSASYMYVPTGYLLMENYLANFLLLKTINVESIVFSYLSLTNPVEIARFLLQEDPEEAINKMRKERRVFSLPEKWNTLEIYKIPLRRYHGADEGFLIYKIEGNRRTPPSKYAWTPEAYYGYVQFTDISATLKVGPAGNLLLARYLKSNAPLTNAKVYRFDPQGEQWNFVGRTGKSGTLLDASGKTSLYMIESEGSRFYISSSFTVSSKVNDGYDDNSKMPACLVFSDRYLYQPGERVFLKGIYRFRHKDNWVVEAPMSGSFCVEVYNSREELLMKTNFPPRERGSFDFWIDIPQTAPTGYYMVKAFFVSEDKQEIAHHYASFQVEEFRPARAEMRIQANKSLYQIGEKMKLDLIGWYLFGAPVGKPVDYDVWFRPVPYQSKDFPGYNFSSVEWGDEYDEYEEYSSRNREIDGGTLEPNKEGVASTMVDLSSIEDDGYLIVSARTTLPDDTPVSGYKSDIEVRKKLHLGIKIPSFFHSVNTPFSISLLALNDKEVIITNEAVLVVSLYEWRSFQVAGHGGRFQWEWREIVTPVYSNQLTVHQTTVPVTIQKPGYYTATVYEKAKGKLIPHGTAWFYVIGGGFYGWRISDDDRVQVTSDKSEYSVGETATLLIQNPYPSARAVITVEREKFYKSYEIPATNSMVTFRLPIEEEYIPNIYVSVLLYTGRTGTNRVSNDVDYARPQYRLGYAHFRVLPKEKTLSVVVTTDKGTYAPRNNVKARIQVKDSAGKPVSAEVTVSVADRGVLNLVNYTLPNPLSFFYAPRPLAISTYESRNFIYGQRYLSEKGEVLGGDGGISMGMILPRSIIKYTAFYEAKLWVTNGDGEVSFTLPDNLTSFKVMAVAHTPSSKFGYGEASFTVKRDLMVLESFPTFVRPWDKFMAGGIVFNYTGKKQTFAVELLVSEGLTLGGTRSMVTNITLAHNSSREVLFPVAVKGKSKNEVTFTLKVMGEGVSDGITRTIPLIVRHFPETVSMYGVLSNRQDKAVNTFAITSNVIPELSSLEVMVAPTAFVELKGNLDYLVEYPYGCLEQKTSCILPLITGEDVILKYGLLHTKTKEELRAVVQTVINEIPEYLKEKGFSYWKDSSYVSGYLTVYVFWVLTLAKQAGYTLDSSFYQRVFELIKGYIQTSTIPDEFLSSYGVLTLSYALYATSLNGYTDIQKLVEIYHQLKKKERENLSARVFFLMALANYPNFKEKETLRGEIVGWLESKKRITAATMSFESDTAWGWFYYTATIQTAQALQAYLSTGVTLSEAYKMINFLLMQRKRHAWTHTHENAWVFYAFSTYLKMFEKEEVQSSYEVLMNAKQILTGVFEKRNQPAQKSVVTFDTEDRGEKTLQVVRKGQGPLYYTYRYRYVPVSPENVSQGFVLEKAYLDPTTGKKVDGMERGKDYLVRITVSTPSTRYMVVVDDALPAGLEVVNLSFATEAYHPYEEQVKRTEMASWWGGGFSHKEIYKDRVFYCADVLYPGKYTITYLVRATLPGTFSLSPCHVEEMYTPDCFATVYFPGNLVVENTENDQ
ncbi:MAG: MG2 domain-containing protein [Brevinematales bacterium]|nr:MG2 domain-containing protein [Brevinematales bacterium]